MRRMTERSARAIGATALALAALGVFVAGRARVDAQPSPTPASASNSPGKAVYEGHCVECHGATGQGDGPAAPHLVPAPRNFTLGHYKIRTTETGSVPTDEDLIRSVRLGLYGTAMPGWDKLLSDADIHDVVGYIKTLSPQFANGPPKPVTLGPQVTSSPESVARGGSVYDKLKCSSCHGTDGRGTNAIATAFEDDSNRPLRAGDLTEPWAFHGGASPRDIYMRFRTGMAGTPMPSFADAASDAEMWDLANYVSSLGRKPVWSMNAEEVKALYARQDAEAKANPVARGAHLVETLGCALCHSPVNEQMQPLPGLRLAGGMLLRIVPYGDYPAGNLTSDKATGLGNWTDLEIRAVITRGTLRDGTRLLPFPMDWPSFSTMKPEDISAIVAYLRTVSPVSNAVPKPARAFLPLYLWGKFKMLILGDDPPIIFFPGNAGTKGGRS